MGARHERRSHLRLHVGVLPPAGSNELREGSEEPFDPDAAHVMILPGNEGCDGEGQGKG